MPTHAFTLHKLAETEALPARRGGVLKMTRHLRQLLCRLLIGLVLFAQMAVAAYACPRVSPPGFNQAPAMLAMALDQNPAAANPVAEMAAGCDAIEQPDPDTPNLCAEHARYGQQSDQKQTPTVPAVLRTSLHIVSLMPDPTAATWPATASASPLAATSPPHAILHCCFRI